MKCSLTICVHRHSFNYECAGWAAASTINRIGLYKHVVVPKTKKITSVMDLILWKITHQTVCAFHVTDILLPGFCNAFGVNLLDMSVNNTVLLVTDNVPK